MTGVGEIFSLFQTYKESRKDLKAEPEEPKLEPDANEVAEGYVDENSDWHHVIQNQEWDTLLQMIQNYDFKKYNPKEVKKTKRRLRVVGAAVWVKNKVKPQAPPEEVPVSPLLALNERQQTALHLAIQNHAPDKYIIRMVFCERKAALCADNEGRLPLHWACIMERNSEVSDRLIRANFHQIQREDVHGKTALYYAVEKAIERKTAQDNQSDYWGIPRTAAESEWQERQLQIWNKARFILLSYSTRRKVFVKGESDLLLRVLENAGPPEIVEVSILAAQGMLKNDPTLASNALRLFMKRQYLIKNLQLLLYHFPEEKMESMEAARKLLTSYYYLGCRKDVNVSGGASKLTFREEMEKHALEPKYKRSLMCQEWWSKIQCLLRLCGHQNSEKKKEIFNNNFLLHAALANSDTPPSLIQLLMVMNPKSIKHRHPFNHSLLIHQICKNWRYNLYPYSKKLGVKLDVDEPPMEQILKIIVASDGTLTRKRYNNRLPLHDAIATSKSVEFLDVLVQKDKRTLSVRDPESLLFPFQLAALNSYNKNAALWAHSRVGEQEWKNLEPEDRAAAVDKVIEDQKSEQMNTIYYLLRQYPAAVSPNVMSSNAFEFSDAHGKGMVSAHFFMLLYAKDVDDSYVVLHSNMEMLEDAILEEEIPPGLEEWWSKMKFWIRYCYDGDLSLPKDDDFLLHAAASNSDVPPIIIELLVAIFPHSPTLSVGSGSEYPLHIAAATPAYESKTFEVEISKKTAIQAIFEAYPKAAAIQCPTGTPYDIARFHETRTPEEMVILGMHNASNNEARSEKGILFNVPTVTEEADSVGSEESSDILQSQKRLENQAAIKVQATFRGYVARARVRRLVDEIIQGMENELGIVPEEADSVGNEESSDISQSQKRLESQAAIKVQATFRGCVARARVRRLVDEIIQGMENELGIDDDGSVVSVL